MPKSDRKIYCGFRLSAAVLRELEWLSRNSGLDKTAVVEIALASARPVLRKLLADRAAALSEKS